MEKSLISTLYDKFDWLLRYRIKIKLIQLSRRRGQMLVYKNWVSSMKFFGVKEFFSFILISKMGVKMISRIIMKNLAADPEIGFLTKSISKPFGRARTCRQRRS